MAKHKAKTNKFITGAVTAAMVATAVVPVASAATEVTFSDVPATDTHYQNINEAVGLGLFKGYTDGTFKPYNTLTRANVAKVLANYVVGQEKLTYSEYIAKHDLVNKVTPFADVPSTHSDKELYNASLIVKDSGIFTGSNNNLMPTKAIQRQQLAKVLVNAFDLKDLPGDLSKVTDNNTAFAEYVPYIDILSENGVTAVEKFRPAETVLRGQMASFLNRAYEIAQNPISKDYKIKVTPAASTIQANGADNTVIKFELLNPAGQVDKNANNIVLEVGTTFGKLANSRVTIQDGVGQVVLQSEFSTRDIQAKITAQIIEAATDEYKALIGKIAGEATVTFSPANVTTDPNAVTFQDAESNQADRVVLYFDKAVSAATFVQTNKDGSFRTTVDKKEQILKENVSIIVEQNGDKKKVVGIVPVKGNDKAVEVLIDKADYLTDNAKVDLDVKIGTTRNQRSFILTDSRQPEFTGVEVVNLRTLDLKFSESYADGKFNIDGILTGVTGKAAGNNEFEVVPGEFNAVKGIDNRHTATVKLGKVVKDNKVVQNYFTAGQHSITVNQLRDWAGLTDDANVSTSQTLNFSVQADETLPKATVSVESAEQFRVTFNKDVDALLATGKTVSELFNDAFKVYNKDAKEWQAISAYTSAFKAEKASVPLDELLIVTKVNETEYVVELRSDWTQLMAKENDVYYNYEFQFDFAKKSFLNLMNGKESEAFKLDLSAVGSALTAPDNKSPEISDIVGTSNWSIYEVQMNEPVKLNGAQGDNAGETLAVKQPSLPVVQAEFQGKNEKGESVVVKAKVVGYSDKDGADKNFTIATEEAEQLQALVNKGYSEDWKVVVRSISDDIGNTASTLTKDFVVTKESKETGFKIITPENDFNHNDAANGIFNGEGVIAYDATERGEKDQLVITFTQAVHQAGVHNLTSTANWTLNGNNLSTLANVETIKVVDTNNNEKDGYERVVITFKDDRAFGNKSNVISVNKNIESLNGTVLSGEYEVVARTVTDALAKAGAAVDKAEGSKTATDIATAQTLVNALANGADKTALQNRLDAIKASVDEEVNLMVDFSQLADTWLVSLKHDELPTDIQGGESYTVTVDGATYELTKNKFDSNIFNGTVDKKHTEAAIKAGTVKKVTAPSAVLADVNGTVEKEQITNTWSVKLKNDDLATNLQGGASYTLTIGTDTYTLTKNKFDANIINGQVDLKHTEAAVKAGIITKN